MTIDFKGSHYPKSVILYAVFFYVRYAVSYRDLEEIMAERGIRVDHATLNRWVVKYSPDIAQTAQLRKRPTAGSWESARIDAGRLQRYLAIYSRPLLPDEAIYPYRARNILMIALVSFGLWAIGTLITYAVRDHIS